MSNNAPQLVKPPHTKTVFSSQQELQDLVKCCDPDTGYEYFMDNFFMIQHPTRGGINYHPYKYQRGLIDSFHRYNRVICLLPRQSGKSTSAAGYLLWYAMFNPDATILIAAHKFSGAQEIMQRVRYAYEACPHHIKAGVTSYNKGSIEFENGSRIVSSTTTENTGRGMSISLLYCDELSFVRPSIAENFISSIMPTLSTGGRLIITSTPSNDEDKFAQMWKQANKTIDEYGNTTDIGANGFRAFRAHWYEHPDRDQAWADKMLAELGSEEKFRREILCEFVSFEETLISSLKLSQLQGEDPLLKAGQVRYYRPIDGTKTYILAWDPSLGTGGDNAAVQVIQLPEMVQVAEWQHNKTDIRGQLRTIRDILAYIDHEIKAQKSKGEIYWSVENNSIGEAALMAIQEMGEQNIAGTFLSEAGKQRKGFTTTFRNKIASCSKLKYWIETDKMKLLSKNLLRELKNFVAAGQSYAAKSGETDDLVMATILCVRMIQMLTNWDQKLFEHLQEDAGKAELIMPMPIGML
jgi:hypothetical protein